MSRDRRPAGADSPPSRRSTARAADTTPRPDHVDVTVDEMSAPTVEAAGLLSDESPDWESALDASSSGGAAEALRTLQAIMAANREIDRHGPDHATLGRPVLFHWGSLEVIEKLGQGSFGEVYRAHDPRLKRDVALKLRRPEPGPARSSARRDLEEGRRLARVRHPNVLMIYGADVHDGRVGLWTDLLEGETLEERLTRLGPLTPGEATQIGVDLGRALAAVHDAGLIHGDVKAANVFREEGGRIVLTDFGSGRELPPDGAGHAAAQLFAPVSATPISAAPEVLRGEAAGPAADVYSLGALLYRLVTGRHAIEADHLDEIRARAERGEHRPLRTARPDLPAAFVAAVERALLPRPGDRWPDAAAMALALAPLVTVPAPARRRPSRTRTLAGVAALAAALTLALLRFHAGSGIDNRPTPALPESAAEPPIEARLYRAGTVAPEPLAASGGRVQPGDALYLEMETGETLHVYVFDEDAGGHLFLLFPVAGVDQTNPLPPGEHRLPGTKGGEPFDWQVTSAGGRETILIVTSRRRLDWLEARVATVAQARPEDAVMFAELSAADLRGISGLTPHTPPGEDGRMLHLSEIAEALAPLAGTGRGIWAGRYELENPAP